MNQTAWQRLKPGEMVENVQTRAKYVLTDRVLRAGWVAVRTVVANDASQWRKVTETERSKR